MNTKMYSNISLVVIIIVTFSSVTFLTTAYPYLNFVQAHNKARESVGVPNIAWNKTLADYAFAYARKCSHNCDELKHSNGPYGENLAEGYGLSRSDAVGMWVYEKRYYDYTSNTCAYGQVCGHYTQVVWKNSTQLGCARVLCSDGQRDFVICSYYPPGNYGGRPY